MFVLYNFGEIIEATFKDRYGPIGLYYFVLLYFGGILFGALPGFAKHRDNIMYTSIGASGATTGLVFSFIAMAPFEKLSLMFLPGLPAIVFGILILAAEYYLSKRGGTNIAHDAHIYGALYGFAFTLFLDKEIMTNFITQLKNVF
jgi:membrane associated rhomboid family serine protease